MGARDKILYLAKRLKMIDTFFEDQERSICRGKNLDEHFDDLQVRLTARTKEFHEKLTELLTREEN
jgi:hypothetical protein